MFKNVSEHLLTFKNVLRTFITAISESYSTASCEKKKIRRDISWIP